MTDVAAGSFGLNFLSTWAESTTTENLLRGVIIVLLCFLPLCIATLVVHGYLGLMKWLGVYIWPSTCSILNRFEHYKKVARNVKIFINKSSLHGNERDIEASRSAHFFSDEYVKLEKDANYFKHNTNRESTPNNPILRPDDIVVCPPDIVMYPVDATNYSTESVAKLVLNHSTDSENEHQQSSPLIDNEIRNRKPFSNTRFSPWQSNEYDEELEQEQNEIKFDKNYDKDEYKRNKYEKKNARMERGLQKGGLNSVTREWMYDEENLADRLEWELRPLSRWLKGNFHLMFANTMWVFIVVLGILFVFFMMGIEIVSFLSGATFLLAVTLFKMGEMLKNLIAFFIITYNDLLERGDIITLPITYCTPAEKTGCVLEITTSCIKVLITQEDNSFEQKDVKWEYTLDKTNKMKTTLQTSSNGGGGVGVVVGGGGGGGKNTTISSLGNYTSSISLSTPKSVTSTTTATTEFPAFTDKISYIERHVRVITGIVNIPNYHFTDYMVFKPLFWRGTLQMKPCPIKSS